MVVKKRSSNKQILRVKGMISLLHPSETAVTSYASHHQNLEQQNRKGWSILEDTTPGQDVTCNFLCHYAVWSQVNN